MTNSPDRPVWSLFFRFRELLSRSSKDELIGAVLVKKKVITEEQLQKAIAFQQEELFEFGKTLPLGQVIVEMGYTSEKNVVEAVNEHYNLSVSSLSDNIKEFVSKIRESMAYELPTPRIPIWLQLSVASMFVIAVSITIFGYVIMERQRAKLFDNTVKLGMVSLSYFSGNAKIPLLNDDILELNTLINNAASVEGQFYAFIVDKSGVIKAHTDHAKLDRKFTPFRNVENSYRKGDVSYYDYTIPGGERILNLSTPILFDGKKLGEAHVGISIDFVRELFYSERAFLAGVTLIIILFGMIVAILIGLRFSRPISKLARATAEIGKGQYDYKVDLKRNDELGTLGEAFNRMGDELYRQSMMKETFGKYVGIDVLDMIMKNPEKGWLKGHRKEVSVLFADIRGYTAYSEMKEPEEVVEKLNEFFEIATGAVLKYGGYVDKFMGDSVLAVFGVPVYHKDHSERCLLAALEMQKEFKQTSQTENTLLKSVGIGVASGVVVAGNIGSQVKTEYTVIGDCVNVVAYLNKVAGPGEIILGNGMGKNFGHLVEVEALEPRKVKGKEERVEIFRVVSSNFDATN